MVELATVHWLTAATQAFNSYNMLADPAAVSTGFAGGTSADGEKAWTTLALSIVLPLMVQSITLSYLPQQYQRRFGILLIAGQLLMAGIVWARFDRTHKAVTPQIVASLTLAALGSYAVFARGDVSVPRLTFTRSPLTYAFVALSLLSALYGFQLVAGQQLWADLGLKYDKYVDAVSFVWGAVFQPRLVATWILLTTLPRDLQVRFAWLQFAWLVGIVASVFYVFDRAAPGTTLNAIVNGGGALLVLVAIVVQFQQGDRVEKRGARRGAANAVDNDDDEAKPEPTRADGVDDEDEDENDGNEEQDEDDDVYEVPAPRSRSKSPARSRSKSPARTASRGRGRGRGGRSPAL